MRGLTFLLAGVFLAVPCRARIIIVDDDGLADFNNIQAAIDDSNGGDTIYVFPGTYTGSGNRDIDFGGRAITVSSTDPNDPNIVAATVVDCQDSGRGFYFHSGEGANSVVSGLTITGGGASLGGGVYCRSSSPTISDCNIVGNTAHYGGGIFNIQSSPLVSSCVFSGNSTLSSGGGMYNWLSNPTVTHCNFSGNSAHYEDEGGGIGLYRSNVTLSSCTISDNIGAGIYCYDASVAVNECTVSQNTGSGIGCEFGSIRTSGCDISGNSGSGIFCYEGDSVALDDCSITGNSAGGIYCIYIVEVTIETCDITGNSRSGRGAGIGCSGRGAVTISNCDIVDNIAMDNGGGIRLYDSVGAITSCRIIGNSSMADGGGISCDAILEITNCAIIGNTAGDMGGGIYSGSSSPAITNCILVGNCAGNYGGGLASFDKSVTGYGSTVSNCSFSGNGAAYGGGIYGFYLSRPVIINSVVANSVSGGGIYWTCATCYNNVWGNVGGDYVGGSGPGVGDISVDPCFVDPGYWDDPCNTPGDANDDVWINGDYHLQSQVGRWDAKSQTWVIDACHSLCIDAGDPNDWDWTGELWPHGKLINIGAYGGTPEASMSGSDVGNTADLDHDGDVDFADYAHFSDKWEVTEVLLAEDLDRNGDVNGVDLGMYTENWLWEQ